MEKRFPSVILAAAAAFALSSCLSSGGGGRIVLPPPSWPAEAAVRFVDGKGRDLAGEHPAGAVKCVVWGVPGVLRSVSIDAEGRVSAERLVLSFPRKTGGSRTIGPVSVSCGADGSATIEWAAADGWTYELEGFADPEAGTFLCHARSEASERLPGRSAFIRLALEGLAATKEGGADWSGASLPEAAVSFDVGEGQDLLSATIAAPVSGASAATADLALYGPSGPLGVVFRGARLEGGGAVSLPAAAEGKASLNLSGGFGVELEEIRPGAEAWTARASLRLPDYFGQGLVLSSGGEGARASSFKTLSIEIPSLEGEASILHGDYEFRLSRMRYEHEGKSILAAGSCSVLSGGADSGLPPLPMTYDGEAFIPSSADVPEGSARSEGYGERIAFTRVEWTGEGFAVGGHYDPPGLLQGSRVAFAGFSFAPDGSLLAPGTEPTAEFAVLGGSSRFFGLAIGPDGSMTAAAIEGTLPGSPPRDYRLADVRFGIPGFPDGTGSGWIGNIAGTKGFTIDSSRPEGEVFVLSGRARIYFSSGTHFIDQTFPTADLKLDRDGRLFLAPVLLEKRTFNAFLGRSFGRVSAGLSGDDFAFTLGGGTFAAGKFLPSGGRVEGLALNLRTQKYIFEETTMPRPASFAFKDASMSLERLEGAIDDAYIFSGKATLPAISGAPWPKRGTYTLKRLRLDEWGNPREIVVEVDGKEADALPWIKK